jgi:uncharacterized RDD family membrane protein YckC
MAEEYQLLTPESVDISYDVAGIGSRFVAATVDLLSQIGLLVLITLGSIGLMQLPEPGPTAGAILLITLYFAVFWGYFIIFETLWSGQTPGKRLAHLRVIKTSGHPIGFIDALVRNLLRIVDFLPSLYALGVVVMFANRRSRRIGDLAAGTVVIKERPRIRMGDLPAPIPNAAHVPPLGAPDPEELAWNLRSLSAQDTQIVADYLDRSTGFPSEVRARVGSEIAHMVAVKIGAREPLDPTPFLRRVLDLTG